MTMLSCTRLSFSSIIRGKRLGLRCRATSLLSRSLNDSQVSLADAKVHSRGDLPYGSREYVLLPPHVELSDLQGNDTDYQSESVSLKIASLRAHRNILFGAQLGASDSAWTLSQACAPLLTVALTDASAEGEQAQAVATLNGLCDWVASGFNSCGDKAVDGALADSLQGMDEVCREACKAMATGLPRPGHSVVGPGTWRDAQPGWENLAKIYVHRQLNDPRSESYLYQQVRGCELVGIEYLASTDPEYMKTAGGCMARFFFL